MIVVVLALAAWYLWPRLQAVQPPGALQPCQLERMDGPYRICLRRDNAGRWTWSASRAGEPPLEGTDPQPSDDDALADAWVTLATRDIGASVIKETREAHGMQLSTDGVLSIVNEAAYVNAAAQSITAAAVSNDEPLGVVGKVLIDAFGSNWNPLRVKIADGTIWDAAKRYADAKAAAGTTPQKQARALAGLA